MKNFIVASIILNALFLTACSSEESPAPVAEKFLIAMQNRNYSEATEYGTKETVKLIRQLQSIEKLNPEDVHPSSGKITIVSEDIQGKVATVYFTEEDNSLQQKITLRKVESPADPGRKVWKVALKKEEMDIHKKHQHIFNANDSLPSKVPA